MFQLKKITLLFAFTFALQFTVKGQVERDLGLIYSKLNGNGLTLEYRQMLGDTYRMRVAITYNQDSQYNAFLNSSITMASDSLITQKAQVYNQQDIGLRFGLLNQLRESVFSLGLDANLAYRNRREGYYEQKTVLTEGGRWEINPTSIFPPLQNPGGSYVTRHYLVPTVRMALNADVPVGTFALIHFELAYGVGLPVYMGASAIQLQHNELVGIPPAIIDMNTTVGIGIRFKL